MNESRDAVSKRGIAYHCNVIEMYKHAVKLFSTR